MARSTVSRHLRVLEEGGLVRGDADGRRICRCIGLFVRTLHNVISRIDQLELDGTPLGELELPGVGTAGTPIGTWNSDSAFYSFSSFTTPRAVYRYDVESNTSEVWSQPEVPFDPAGWSER